MDGPKNNTLAILLPKMDTFSETFIHAQVEFLQPLFLLHGGVFPKEITDTRTRETTALRYDAMDGAESAPGPVQHAVLADWMRENGVRVLLAQYGVCGAAVAPACRMAGVRLIVHFHGFDASRRSTLEAFARPYLAMFEAAHAVIVVSRPMHAQLLNMGCPEAKLVYNPYGVQDRFFSVQPAFRDQVFVAVGRFVEKKGPLLTLEAFRRVHARFPAARLWMAGDGPLLDACRDTVRNDGLDRVVMFPGILRHDMVPAFLQRGLAFVQHSVRAPSGDSEGTPVAILEAAASGLPVVSTRHAGIPEAVLDEVSGLLVEEGNVSAMADAMCRLLDTPGLAVRMGEAGRKHMQEHYTMKRYLATLEALLADIGTT
jgi:glycosyltransferase involved in cell wall biosynthesis